MDIGRNNLRQVYQLNQRGGPSLGIVDLIEAGTLSEEMAALCWLEIARGASFMTGAVPGGAGKTTLMAALLGFLPQGERIITVDGPAVIQDALRGGLARPCSLLAHEIGSGPWYGYIWGREAAEFFSLAGRGFRCVTCLHADDPGQARDQLLPLGVARDDFDRVRLQLYMCVQGGRGRAVRRVSLLCCRLDGRLQPAFRWTPGADAFEAQVERREFCRLLAEPDGVSPGALEAAWRGYQDRLAELVREGVRHYEAVRARLVEGLSP